MIGCTFVSWFNDRYEKTGKKNLRCFPRCSDRGHISSGFCGKPVVCEVDFAKALELNPTAPHERLELRAWGEFVVCGTAEEWRLQSQHSIEEITAKERKRSQPTLPWVRGEVHEATKNGPGAVTASVATLTFNEQLLGWHYNWMSSKNTCDSYHTFLVRFFVKESMSSNLIYIGSAKSPRFQLFSRHRIRVLQKLKRATKDEIVTDGQHLVDKACSTSKPLTVQRVKLENAVESKTVSSRSSRSPKQVDNNGEAERKRSGKRPNATQLHQDRQHDLLLHQLRAGETPSSFSRKEKTELRRKLDQIIDRSKPPKKRLRAPMGVDPMPEASSHLGAPQVAEAIEQLQDKNVYTTITRLVTFLVFFADGVGSAPTSAVVGVRKDNSMSSRQQDGTMSAGVGRQTSEDGLEEFSAYLLQDIIGTLLPNEFFDCGYESGARSTGTASSDVRVKNEAVEESRHVSSDTYSGFDALRQAVLETGSERAVANVNCVVEHIEQMADHLLFEKEISEKLSELFRKWSEKSYEGFQEALMMPKRKRSDKGSVNLRDFETLKDMLETGKAVTFSGELRLVVFSYMLQFMKSRNMEVDLFVEVMEIAARTGILPFDFDVPPRPVIAQFIHLQVSGDAKKIKEEDFGSEAGRFQSIEQKIAWRRALQSFILSMFRFAVIARVKQERQFSKLPSPATPVGKCLELVSDTWIRVVDAGAEADRLLFSEMIRKLSGVHLGSFFGKLMDSMFQRVQVLISKEAILLQGEKKLFTSSSFLFYLDGQPHAFAMPQPIPFPGHTGKQWVCSWIDKECVKIVGGGPVTPAPSSDYARRMESNSKSTSKSTSKSSEFSDRQLEIRLAGQIRLSSDRTMLLVDTTMHIFEDATAAPFTSKAKLSGLFQKNTKSEVCAQTLKFVRYFNFDFSP